MVCVEPLRELVPVLIKKNDDLCGPRSRKSSALQRVMSLRLLPGVNVRCQCEVAYTLLRFAGLHCLALSVAGKLPRSRWKKTMGDFAKALRTVVVVTLIS